MAAYKDKNGTWYVSFYYRDWQGNNKRKVKRGFRTKKESLEWEQEFKQRQSNDLDMTFESFIAIYVDMELRLKKNTWQTKNILLTRKLPHHLKIEK